MTATTAPTTPPTTPDDPGRTRDVARSRLRTPHDGSAASDRAALVLLGAWSAATGLLLLVPVGALGGRVLVAVVVWHVAVLAVAARRDSGRPDRAWLSAYALVAPMSLLLVLPDWVLAVGLGTIVFPDTGAPYVGAIPVFMAGMWAVPLAVVVLVGRAAQRARGAAAGLAAGTAAGLAVFAASEATLWALPVWEAVDVTEVAHVALYVLPAEAVLCATAVLADQRLRHLPLDVRGLAVRALTGAFLVQAYAGGLVIGWLLLER